jgi:hypothetical protein
LNAGNNAGIYADINAAINADTNADIAAHQKAATVGGISWYVGGFAGERRAWRAL